MATNCYQNHKQKLPKERRERYQNLTEEEEEKGVIRIFLRKKRSKS